MYVHPLVFNQSTYIQNIPLLIESSANYHRILSPSSHSPRYTQVGVITESWCKNKKAKTFHINVYQ